MHLSTPFVWRRSQGDPPSMKWSDLKYVFWHLPEGDLN
jgi:hypothetical protein